jgi:hypothetical protein
VKILRSVLALTALLAVALRGIFSFLNWFENQVETEINWADEEELEEAF